MKPKKLSAEKLDKLQEMLLEGKTPQDAAQYFDVAISSIHNYKRELREHGVELPNVRGQRPKGIIFVLTEEKVDPKTAPKPADPIEIFFYDKSLYKEFTLVKVGEMSVYVKNNAKNVSVTGNQITILF